jgi:hypothetical protein
MKGVHGIPRSHHARAGVLLNRYHRAIEQYGFLCFYGATDANTGASHDPRSRILKSR